MQAVNINGTHIHYRLDGRPTGPTLAFVNSLGTDWRVWERVAARFADRYRLLFHDKRGHGLSDAPDGPLAMADHVGDLSALLDALAIEQMVVCGLSVGGMIALGLAAEQPPGLRGLVLCDTGHRIGTAELWNQRIGAIHAQGMEAVADGALERWFSADFRASHPAETAMWRNMLLRTPARGYTATCAAIRDADLTEAARSLALPALCLCGTEDQATPPELVRELSALMPAGRYHDIPGAGHLPTVESAATVADRIESFLEELNLD
jgi:3-oxoadipate enol-lactonase